jgi:hypothetical protein
MVQALARGCVCVVVCRLNFNKYMRVRTGKKNGVVGWRWRRGATLVYARV